MLPSVRALRRSLISMVQGPRQDVVKKVFSGRVAMMTLAQRFRDLGERGELNLPDTLLAQLEHVAQPRKRLGRCLGIMKHRFLENKPFQPRQIGIVPQQDGGESLRG